MVNLVVLASVLSATTVKRSSTFSRKKSAPQRISWLRLCRTDSSHQPSNVRECREKKHIRTIVRRAGSRMMIHHFGTAVLGSMLITITAIPRAIIGFFNDKYVTAPALYRFVVQCIIVCLAFWFLANVNFAICRRPSVCLSSVVCL